MALSSSLEPVLSVDNLTTSFRVNGEWRSVVRNMSFTVAPRETWRLWANPAPAKA